MSLPGKIETTANIATIGAAVLLSAVLIKVYLVPGLLAGKRTATQAADAAIGTSLKDRLPGIDWNRNGQTLVLAISTHCHFCTESAPFFRRLGDEAREKVKMVAVLPESIADAEQYLSSEGVHIDQVKQAPPGSIGVRGTPTMLLVDRGGIVTRVWVGKLDPQGQEQVMSTLLGRHAAGAPGRPGPASALTRPGDGLEAPARGRRG
jgi:hypothetical protein